MHAWLGGDMATVGLCAYDPLYWAHRAMVDRLWASWQERHPSADVPDEIKKTPEGLHIGWSDGHASLYPYARLRALCRCASCTGGH